jgi:hypothetical protein
MTSEPSGSSQVLGIRWLAHFQDSSTMFWGVAYICDMFSWALQESVVLPSCFQKHPPFSARLWYLGTKGTFHAFWLWTQLSPLFFWDRWASLNPICALPHKSSAKISMRPYLWSEWSCFHLFSAWLTFTAYISNWHFLLRVPNESGQKPLPLVITVSLTGISKEHGENYEPMTLSFLFLFKIILSVSLSRLQGSIKSRDPSWVSAYSILLFRHGFPLMLCILVNVKWKMEYQRDCDF